MGKNTTMKNVVERTKKKNKKANLNNNNSHSTNKSDLVTKLKNSLGLSHTKIEQKLTDLNNTVKKKRKLEESCLDDSPSSNVKKSKKKKKLPKPADSTDSENEIEPSKLEKSFEEQKKIDSSNVPDKNKSKKTSNGSKSSVSEPNIGKKNRQPGLAIMMQEFDDEDEDSNYKTETIRPNFFNEDNVVSSSKSKTIGDDASDNVVPLSKKSIANNGASDSSDSDDDGAAISQGQMKKQRKKRRLARKLAAQEAEAKLRDQELTKSNRLPQTELQFREMLLSNGSCSATWIHFISFLMSKGEADKAHVIARRGLSVIPFEEQKERLNLWTVLLRLEVMQDMDESKVAATLQEAVNNCDDFAIRSNLAAIYQDVQQYEKSEALFVKLRKKYYAEKKSWEQLGFFYYKLGRLDQARETLRQAVSTLNKRFGVDVTSRFAHLELKHGDKQKSVNMFESLIQNYPKRLDIWNVYADLFVKEKDIEQARSILSRFCSQPMNCTKKINAFKKWSEFETEHGTTKTQAQVKQRIAKYGEHELNELNA